MKKTYFNWSSGKDSALALYYLLQDENLHIDRLLTSVNTHYDRVSMHGLRRSLLESQVKAIGLPHTTIDLPQNPTMEEYQKMMTSVVDKLKKEGYKACGFGDIFLEDLRTYREEQLEGIQCYFPLWKKNTKELLEEFLALGFRTILVSLNGEQLDPSFLGREIDQNFINELLENVDPCGENGEFHTFCYDGPIFSKPVAFEIGEKIKRSYPKPNAMDGETIDYWFLDLLPAKGE
ncbi:MAG: adenine nucleotide alpha hydrolase [Flavobacteriales bacterium]|jgi:uncharacterized protein (TIGR00290 family)|nr:adenine nucleotide alpha hydrolase [Flavobacteriales bacterium]